MKQTKQRKNPKRTTRKQMAVKLTGRRRDKLDWANQEMRRYSQRYPVTGK